MPALTKAIHGQQTLIQSQNKVIQQFQTDIVIIKQKASEV
jgi:hypothetical protein